jgi:hypothetical protein
MVLSPDTVQHFISQRCSDWSACELARTTQATYSQKRRLFPHRLRLTLQISDCWSLDRQLTFNKADSTLLAASSLAKSDISKRRQTRLDDVALRGCSECQSASFATKLHNRGAFYPHFQAQLQRIAGATAQVALRHSKMCECQPTSLR